MAMAPRMPAAGPFRPSFWRSPLRGPWLASLLSSALLPLLLACSVTGFLSHAAYQPHLGHNAIFGGPGGGLDLYGWTWPASPSWLYAATQGTHVVTGLAAIPILLAKLWTVIPKLFENPPVRSPWHLVERLSLALLMGGALFTIGTGVVNIQLWYPFGFSFVPAHYYGAIVFLAALALHLALKLPVMRAAFARDGVLRPLRADLEHTEPESGLPGMATSAPAAPRAPTMTRRGLVATVGAGSLGLAVMGLGQVVGGPLRPLALLAPRGRGDFPVNKTFAAVGIERDAVGPGWRLELLAGGERRARLRREELLDMELVTARLPIACVEGWTTTQEWTGVRLSDLARMADAPGAREVEVRSLQPRGRLRRVTLNSAQLHADDSLLALRANGADLTLDHGYPARVIVPALPGVHCTKWVGELAFRS
jgi:DMSO/TMAO reductase YedYZ molybdopterin-dependent catalytic subunit